jgi:D-alanine-D-alanine ligase
MKVYLVYSKKRMQSIEEEIYKDTPEMKGETLKAIAKALRGSNDVFLLNEDESIVNKLKNENIDIIFNLSTGLRGESRQSHVPAILERVGILYTGSGRACPCSRVE